MSRHQIHRPSKAGAGDFQPLFDWDAPPEAVRPDSSDPLGALRSACQRHIEGGGLVARQFFGVEVVDRKRLDDRLTGRYRAANYCDPLAALLDGQPYASGILSDAARLLGVDEYWLAGFIHGLDRTELWVGRREEKFSESASYKAGYRVGKEVGAEFARIQVGWEG